MWDRAQYQDLTEAFPRHYGYEDPRAPWNQRMGEIRKQFNSLTPVVKDVLQVFEDITVWGRTHDDPFKRDKTEATQLAERIFALFPIGCTLHWTHLTFEIKEAGLAIEKAIETQYGYFEQLGVAPHRAPLLSQREKAQQDTDADAMVLKIRWRLLEKNPAAIMVNCHGILNMRNRNPDFPFNMIKPEAKGFAHYMLAEIAPTDQWIHWHLSEAVRFYQVACEKCEDAETQQAFQTAVRWFEYHIETVVLDEEDKTRIRPADSTPQSGRAATQRRTRHLERMTDDCDGLYDAGKFAECVDRAYYVIGVMNDFLIVDSIALAKAHFMLAKAGPKQTARKVNSLMHAFVAYNLYDKYQRDGRAGCLEARMEVEPQMWLLALEAGVRSPTWEAKLAPLQQKNAEETLARQQEKNAEEQLLLVAAPIEKERAESRTSDEEVELAKREVELAAINPPATEQGKRLLLMQQRYLTVTARCKEMNAKQEAGFSDAMEHLWELAWIQPDVAITQLRRHLDLKDLRGLNRAWCNITVALLSSEDEERWRCLVDALNGYIEEDERIRREKQNRGEEFEKYNKIGGIIEDVLFKRLDLTDEQVNNALEMDRRKKAAAAAEPEEEL